MQRGFDKILPVLHLVGLSPEPNVRARELDRHQARLLANGGHHLLQGRHVSSGSIPVGRIRGGDRNDSFYFPGDRRVQAEGRVPHVYNLGRRLPAGRRITLSPLGQVR